MCKSYSKECRMISCDARKMSCLYRQQNNAPAALELVYKSTLLAELCARVAASLKENIHARSIQPKSLWPAPVERLTTGSNDHVLPGMHQSFSKAEGIQTSLGGPARFGSAQHGPWTPHGR